MKGIKFTVIALCASIVLSGCNGLSNAAKGGMIGGASGGAVGAGVGALIAKLTKGGMSTGKAAAIGAAVGVAAGSTAGALIGHKMDKAKKAAAALQGAQAELLEDGMGVKVTFESGLLFATGNASLSPAAQSSLKQFAQNVVTPDMDLAIVGHTDNTPFKNCTAEQSKAKNQTLSEQRASSVSNYLKNQGCTATQIKDVRGMGETAPIADNATAEGKKQNRRVEVYIIPSAEMVEAAKNGSLKD